MSKKKDPPVEPPNDPSQQGTDPPTAPGENWEARYKGMLPVVEKLTTEKDSMQVQLEQLTSQNEQLEAQLALKDTEKGAAIGERDKQLQELLEAKQSQDKELNELRSLKLKVKVANDLGDPGLVAIVDSIPSVQDEETLTTIMKNISDWGTEQLQKREKELLAGVTTQTTSTPVSEPLPESNEDWQTYVEKAEIGTTEREQRMEAWRQWGLSQMR